jgi:hypothetical protein
MTAPVQKKTRRGGAGSLWGQVMREVASAFYRGLPWLAIGLAIGLEGVR